MGGRVKEHSWGTEKRLEFIESYLYWEDGIRRADIMSKFGVSIQQASKDLTLYQELAPKNAYYDKTKKKYFASDKFKPKFIDLNAEAYLERLREMKKAARAEGDLLSGILPEAERLPLPLRSIRATVLRATLSAVRNRQSIEILYQSMNVQRPEPEWRRISPHAFASDGLRWHVRAYCHLVGQFKDFILSRSLEARAPAPSETHGGLDKLWNELIPVVLCPNPKLSVSQQTVVAEDFVMKDGVVTVGIRQAMLYYFNKRLRLDVGEKFDDPKETPIVVKNRTEFDKALLEVAQANSPNQ